jgi:hypothetical protein
MATATVSKGKSAPEGDLVITPPLGEQFTVGSDSYQTDDVALVASLGSLVEAGTLDVSWATDEADNSEAEARKAADKAAKQRYRDIQADKPLEELTPVPDTAQGDPDPDATDLAGSDN